MRQQFWLGRVADVDQGQAAIPPGTVGDVPGNDGVVKRNAIAFAPRRLFATGRPLAGQPPATDLERPGWIGYVDDHEYVVAVAIQQGRDIRILAADVPHPVAPQALDRELSDLARLVGLRDVVHPKAGAVVDAALAENICTRLLDRVLDRLGVVALLL